MDPCWLVSCPGAKDVPASLGTASTRGLRVIPTGSGRSSHAAETDRTTGQKKPPLGEGGSPYVGAVDVEPSSVALFAGRGVGVFGMRKRHSTGQAQGRSRSSGRAFAGRFFGRV